jgi:8-oxo-dGTP diphosphatase
MIHRNLRLADDHLGKWNGLGGKLEPGESPLEAACRELREESGLDLPRGCFKPLGSMLFPNFKPHKQEDWLVYIWVAQLSRRASETPVASCREGTLHWINAADVLSLNLWEGDRHFIPYVIQEQPFQGTIWYEAGQVARHEIQLLD